MIRSDLSSTVADLTTAIVRSTGATGSFYLVSRVAGGRLPADATVGSLQLRHGETLELVSSDDPWGGDEALPLGSRDAYRLTSDTGPQLGMAWPIVPGFVTLLTIRSGDIVAGRLVPDQDDFVLEGEQLGLVLTAEGVDVVPGLRLLASINGTGVDTSSELVAGSNLEVRLGRVRMSWRLLTPGDHDRTRGMGQVSYRVGLREAPPAESPQVRLALRPMPVARDQESIWLDILTLDAPMALMYLVLSLVVGFNPFFLVLPLLSVFRIYRRVRDSRQRERTAQDESARWLREVDAELGVAMAAAEGYRSAIEKVHRPFGDLRTRAISLRSGMWELRPHHADFLNVSVGRGTTVVPVEIDVPGPLTDADMAAVRARANDARTLEDSPVLLDLSEVSASIQGPSPYMHAVARAVVTRIAVMHSPAALGIAALLPVDRRELRQMTWLEWLPHIHSPSNILAGRRLLHGSGEATRSIAQALGLEAVGDDHLLVIAHEAALTGDGLAVLRRWVRTSNGRVHVLWLSTSRDRQPPDLVDVAVKVTAHEVGGATLSLAPDGRSADADGESLEGATELAAMLAALVDDEATGASTSVPELVELPEVLGLGEAGVTERLIAEWRQASAVDDLIACPGWDTEGPFELSLVEHGPHFLIGGTTGSGKSELLRALALSLMARYAPRELALMFIDFKGGAAFTDLKRAPHEVAFVSNLEAHDVRRLVRFLEAEINRRQRMFRNNQGEYSRYRTATGRAVPRLVVFVDEFAGFMGGRREHEDAIVNIAARGRSLGVHLILATQRPKGSVSPEISANVNGRICLRVLDESDSLAVLDEPVAARLARSLVGRGYARLDSGLIHEFQSAFTQSKRYQQAALHGPLIVEPFQPVLSRASGSDQSAAGSDTDLDVFFDAIEGSRRTKGFVEESRRVASSQPVLAASLSDWKRVPPPRSPAEFSTAIPLGLEDLPHRQRQEPGDHDLGVGGLLVAGRGGTGKTALLWNILVSFRSMPETQAVVIDCGDGELARLAVGLGAYAVPAFNRADITFVVDQIYRQLTADGPLGADLLLVIDRLDIAQDAFRDLTVLSRIIATGQRRRTYTVASWDPTLELDVSLRRAFRSRRSLAGHLDPGRLIDELDNELQVYEPARPATVVVGTPSHPRPIGPAKPDASLDAEVNRETPDVVLGIDRMSHEPVRISTRASMGIAGPPASGRSVALHTVARRWARTLGDDVRLPYIGPHDVSSFSWLRDLGHELHGIAHDAEELAATLATAFRADGEDVPYPLVIDDIARMEFSLPLYAANATPIVITAIQLAVQRHRVPLVATGDMEVLSPIGAWRASLDPSLRNYIVLGATAEFISTSRGHGHHIDAAVQPREQAYYQPGQGVAVIGRNRYELDVYPDPSVSRFFQEGGQ